MCYIKINIMSMQRVINYGSFLQAYRLKKTIEKLGHSVEFTDFHVEPCLIRKDAGIPLHIKLKSRLKQLIRKAGHAVFYKSYKKNKANEYESYIKLKGEIKSSCKNFLEIDENKNYLSKADVLVIGSDEVFNCLNTDSGVGYSMELFGKNSRADRIISYAVSFGNTTYERVCESGVKDEISDLLKKFDAISVRDKNSLNIISKLINHEPCYHIDPVLLYSFSKELDVIPAPQIKNYILVYAYPYRISKAEGKNIKNFAKKHNKKIISLLGNQSFCNEHITCSPFEALNYFKNAEYVVTDTFHGAVMSVKYNKNFAVFVRSSKENQYGNEEKIFDLLERFSLTSRIVRRKNEMSGILESDIDYTGVNIVLKKEINSSEEYLRSLL